MGFRLSKSCSDNLVTFINYIQVSFLNGYTIICIFLDIGAFDNVVPSILIQNLSEIGIPVQLRKFIFNLNERNLFFIIDGNLASPYKSYKNILQGFNSESAPIQHIFEKY